MKFFKRFNKIDSNYIYTDKHIHSNWVDGEAGISQIIAVAERIKGLKQIAFTEHVRRESRFVNKYLREIKKFKKGSSIEVLSGLEARIANFQGDIDVAADMLQNANIRIASVHRFSLGRVLHDPKEFTKELCAEIELELSIAAIKGEVCNVLGHAGGMSLQIYKEFPIGFFEEIISECVRHNIVFELNYRYHRSIFNCLKPLLKKYNPYVSIGSDAHTTQELGSWVGILTGELARA
ncbi:MAG: PHP domain-containing protein [Candidatus Omnitrophota bacterium]